MDPVLLAILLTILWAGLRLWLAGLEKSWKAEDLRGRMSRAGTLAALDKLAELAGIGALAVAAIVLLVGIASALAGSDVLWSRRAVAGLASLHGGVKAFSDSFGWILAWTGALGAAGALWWMAAVSKERAAELWTRTAEEEYAAIRADPSRLDEARGDAEIGPSVERIEAVRKKLAKGEGKLDRKQRALLESQLEANFRFVAVERARRAIDIASAAAIPREPSLETLPPWRRLVRSAGSKRFAEDLKLVRKPVSRLATALLFVSLLGWSTDPLAHGLRLNVNNLRVQLAVQAAERDLQLALKQEDAPPRQIEESEGPGSSTAAATRIVARAMMHELVRADLLGEATQVRRSPDSEVRVVRSLLAEQRLDPDSGPAADLLNRETVVLTARSVSDAPAPAELYVQAQVRPVVERMQREQPNRLSRLVARLEARYSAPVTALDAIGTVTQQVLDEAAKLADAKPGTQAGIEARRLARDFGKKAIRTWIDARVKSMLADYLTGAVRPRVERAMAIEAGSRSRKLVASLGAGGKWLPGRVAAAEAGMGSKVAEIVTERLEPRPEAAGAQDDSRQAVRERLAGYDSVFPIVAEESGTGDLPLPDLPAGRSAGESPEAPGRARPRSRFASFAFATRSFSARGVVIGRNATGRLDATDMRWAEVPPAASGAAKRLAVDLRLIRADGSAEWRRAGVFDAGILNQALHYAADGRTVAATIMGGDGDQLALVYHLHPALIDTPLGCRVIEADTWIDRFTGPRQIVSEAARPVSLDRLRILEWKARIAQAEPAITDEAGYCPIGESSGFEAGQGGSRPLLSPEQDEGLTGFMSKLQSRPPGGTVFLRRATRCSQLSEARRQACICSPSGSPDIPARYWFPEDHTSQLRERPLRLTPDFSWLQPSRDRMRHLDFWLHTTFSLRASGKPNPDHTAAWDFPDSAIAALRSVVLRQLPPYLSNSRMRSSYEEFMRPLEEFVLAQRLARAALDGQLGPDFPVARLLRLARQTRPFVPSQPTQRWAAAGDGKELAALLREEEPQAARLYVRHHNDVVRRRNKEPLCAPASR